MTQLDMGLVACIIPRTKYVQRASKKINGMPGMSTVQVRIEWRALADQGD